MKPLKRKPVQKARSAAKFRRNVSTVKAANMAVKPMRGGWRF
ncbi:hypothetical protein [Gokushovirinae Fen7875_21]|nr:hypothetical protein [Gokushovirinae Fen7875_21]AKI26939.1 hypothetical protein [Gokushovirinae Fen7875_21]